MGIRFCVNVLLLAIPIGTTLGVLLGIQEHRQATGQTPLFAPSPAPPDSLYSPIPRKNGISTTQYCEKSRSIQPETKGDIYIYNPNQWGWDKGSGGDLCMNITTFNNNTYPTKANAPSWSVTWTYPQGAETQPVHAYPNVEIGKPDLPTQLKDISRIYFDVEWTYNVGNDTTYFTNISALTAAEINANVAIDLFMDRNKKNSADSSKATYEIMIWFAVLGSAAEPIGFKEGEIVNRTINGTLFSLYYGQNQKNQKVLTWVTSEIIEKFQGDIVPLVNELPTHLYCPSGSDYLGYMAFGTEAYWSKSFSTFFVPHMSVELGK